MFAQGIDFAEVETQMIATAVSELARNIIKYAEKGEIVIDQIDVCQVQQLLDVAKLVRLIGLGDQGYRINKR